MHKSTTKCNEILSKWCKNKHGASKIMDTLETDQMAAGLDRNKEEKKCFLSNQRSGDSTDYQKADQAT
jgi:hypothetical protein